MGRTTLLVHLQLGRSNRSTLALARQLAERFTADVIGIAACQPMLVVSGDGFVCGDVFADDQRQLTADLGAAEKAFRDVFRGDRCGVAWRATISIDTVTDYLAHQARCADLIVTGAVSSDTLDLAHDIHPGTLAIQAGRPVLVVPQDVEPLLFEHAVVGWKDTRESRRATADALPLLRSYGRVSVIEVAPVDDIAEATIRVLDVAAWLVRHGIAAEGIAAVRLGDDGRQLAQFAAAGGADLLVAGAFGHSPLREWVLGGATRSLVTDAKRCVLLSH